MVEFNKSVMEVIDRHEYVYSDSDSSSEECSNNSELSTVCESSEKSESEDEFVVETRRKLEKIKLVPRANSQPPDSRAKYLPVIGKNGQQLGVRMITPSKTVR